jgi:branched-chain amino acid transport system permease protein
VSAERFGILIALGFVAFAYVGGITMVSGAVFGGLIASEGVMSHLMQSVLGISGTWTLLIGGVTLILNLRFFPDGVAGSQYQKKKQKELAKQRAAQPPTPSPVAATVAGGSDR